MNRIRIINGKIISPFREVTGHDVCIDGGLIAGICQAGSAFPDAEIMDAGGRYVAPGFIDIHTHGAGGHDFMDGTAEAFLGAAAMHAQHGTTTLTPTTLAGDMTELRHILRIFKEVKRMRFDGPEMPGMHLEGPYFSLNQCGAQDPRFIHDPDPDEYKSIIRESEGCIIRWSAAPELKGAMEFGRYCQKQGILPSIAHTDAIDSDVELAFQNGFSHVTHLYSAMSGVTRRNAFRYAGVIESAFLIDGLTVEIIADGVHLPKSLLQLIYKIKGPGRIALVTDSMRAAGMPEGPSILGKTGSGMEVVVEDGVAKMPDRLAFAGSVATADRLVRTMVQLAEVPLTEAVRMMTATPASICGIAGRKGSIEPGKDADLVIFDDDIRIHTTMVKGKIIFSQS